MKVVFLGSGGSRQMVATQERKTGGLLFDLEKVKFVLDPGPGSVVNAISIGVDPSKLNGVVLSHLHIDHVTDANVYLDCIEKPFVIAEQHCLLTNSQAKTDFDHHPCITVFHQAKSKCYPVKDGDEVDISGVKFRAVRVDHYDPAVGFRITCGDVDVGYVADGDYYKGLEKHYDGCRVIIANVIVPKGKEVTPRRYLSVDGLISLLNGMKEKPKLVVLAHLNAWMLRSNIWKQEKILQEATKIKNVIHAEDFMAIDLQTLKTSSAAVDPRDRLKL